MGVPASEVGYTSATARRGDHESSYEHVVALERKIYILYTALCNILGLFFLQRQENVQILKKENHEEKNVRISKKMVNYPLQHLIR